MATNFHYPSNTLGTSTYDPNTDTLILGPSPNLFTLIPFTGSLPNNVPHLLPLFSANTQNLKY